MIARGAAKGRRTAIPLYGFAARRRAGWCCRRSRPIAPPFIPQLAAVMFALFLAANAVRWWVIRTLGETLERQVM